MLKQQNHEPAYVARVSPFQRWLSRSASRVSVSPLWCGIVLFALALVSRLYRLDVQSLWLDELNTWWLVRTTDWTTLWDALWQSNSAYPLYHLLLKAWVAAAGNSEAALRLPSAVVGAAAVSIMYFAAWEMAKDPGPSQAGTPGQASWFAPGAIVCAMLCLTAPFAIWYAQEVKTYSLLLLTSAATVWLLFRTLRRGVDRCGPAHWLACAGVALISLFVHRFAVLLLLGCAFAWVVAGDPARRRLALRIAAGVVLCGLSFLVVEQLRHGLRYEDAITGAHHAVGPLEAAQITIWRFALDRNPYEVSWLWLIPSAVLATWGLLTLLKDAWRGHQRALALLCCAGVPLILFLAQLWWTRLYEPRYLMIVYPAWFLLLSYPSIRAVALRSVPSWLVPAATVLVGLVMLFQAPLGLWSGSPVKEQFREAVRLIAQRAHPDDAIILHPGYIRPAWYYYSRYSSLDSLPEPITFDAFKQGQTAYSAKDWDTSRERQLQGHLRSFLLIAPFHARTVDRPPAPQDEYGLVGLYYQYSWEQQKWPCGSARFNGVHVFCQASPEPYGLNTATPQPAIARQATFDDGIILRGYTINPFNGVMQAGGTLPITLFWNVTHKPSADYSVFLHLCRDCTQPPVASDDYPPLGGGVPTSIWLPGHPVHDERAIILPPDLPPGRYTLLLGLYRPGDSSPAARLAVKGEAAIGENRVLLGEVEIVGSAASGAPKIMLQ